MDLDVEVIKAHDAHRSARTAQELAAWADLIDLCEDDCAVFETTPEMRSAVLKVERELARLHEVERQAIGLARKVLMLTGADQ